jgi:hypothetical protein
MRRTGRGTSTTNRSGSGGRISGPSEPLPPAPPITTRSVPVSAENGSAPATSPATGGNRDRARAASAAVW